jgi:hypothetical protein
LGVFAASDGILEILDGEKLLVPARRTDGEDCLYDSLGLLDHPSLFEHSLPLTCKARASPAIRRASSSVLPAVTQPGKSGNLTPKSEGRSLWRYAM